VPRGAAVVRYEGERGVAWRIKYVDGAGKQVMETVGRAVDGVTEQDAKRTLRERLVDVSRDGLRKPERLTFEQFADRWLEEYLPGRNLKPKANDGAELRDLRRATLDTVLRCLLPLRA
jgi:hypothetical protein